MTMIKFYYYGMPILMFAQTILMLYGVAALKGINRKMGRDKKSNDRRQICECHK